MTDYRKLIETKQTEAERIAADVRKAEKRLNELRSRLAKKNREIRDLMKADREQWYKALIERLDEAFVKEKGEAYWQELDAAKVASAIAGEDISALPVTGEDNGTKTPEEESR